MVSYREAVAYLRLYSYAPEVYVTQALESALNTCREVSRLPDETWDEIVEYHGTDSDKTQMKELLRVGVFYAIGWRYEYGMDVDDHDLVLVLRNIYFAIREKQMVWEVT